MRKDKLMSVYILLIAISVGGLFGCAQSPSSGEIEPEINLPIKDFVEITLLESNVSFDSLIPIYITNELNDCIVFPYNYGVRIFAYRGSDWLEIPDLVKHVSHKEIILKAKGDRDDNGGISLFPDYQGLDILSEPLRIKIFVIGKLCQNGVVTENKVADFIEFTISP